MPGKEIGTNESSVQPSTVQVIDTGIAEKIRRDVDEMDSIIARINDISRGSGIATIVAYARPGENLDGYEPTVSIGGDVASINVLKTSIDAEVMLATAQSTFMRFADAINNVIDDENAEGDRDESEVVDDDHEVDEDTELVEAPRPAEPEEIDIDLPEHHRDGYTPQDLVFECETCDQSDHRIDQCIKSVTAFRKGNRSFVRTTYTCPESGETIKKYLYAID